MDEIHKYQESIRNSIVQENERHDELHRGYKLDEMILTAKEYHDKLVSIKRSILILTDRAKKLKRKASKMLEDKNREEVELRLSIERRERIEKHLEPVFNVNSSEDRGT